MEGPGLGGALTVSLRLSQANNSNESSTARRCLSTCGYERVALSKSLGEGKELPVAVAQ